MSKLTKLDWPEYNGMSKLDNGRWEVFLQNTDGNTYRMTFRDPIMAEADAKKNADRLGISLKLTVHHNA